MMCMIDQLSNYTNYQITLHGTKIELEAVLQWIRNVNTNFSCFEYEAHATIDEKGNLDMKIYSMSSRMRDAQMAENLLWIVAHFPEEKIVVDLANFHGAKDISQTCYTQDSLFYFMHPCMAEMVHHELGNKMYSLAFAPRAKTWNTVIYNDLSIMGLLEVAISEKWGDAPYAFLDFEPLRYKDGFRNKTFDAAMRGKKQGKWQFIFDGIYYIRDEKIYHWYVDPEQAYLESIQEKNNK